MKKYLPFTVLIALILLGMCISEIYPLFFRLLGVVIVWSTETVWHSIGLGIFLLDFIYILALCIFLASEAERNKNGVKSD